MRTSSGILPRCTASLYSRSAMNMPCKDMFPAQEHAFCADKSCHTKISKYDTRNHGDRGSHLRGELASDRTAVAHG